jgi:hypothetical protein
MPASATGEGNLLPHVDMGKTRLLDPADGCRTTGREIVVKSVLGV